VGDLGVVDQAGRFLDELPYCEDILSGLPPSLKARLFAALDLNVLWNKTGGQVTVYATITDATLAFLTDVLDPGQDGYHDTAAPALADNDMWALAQPPIAGLTAHGHRGTSRPAHSFLATSGPVMRASRGKVAAMMPSAARIPPAVRR
jgi:hypothetical protein